MAKLYAFLTALMDRFQREQEGQALVEYALILALVAVVVIIALTFLGGADGNPGVGEIFWKILNAF